MLYCKGFIFIHIKKKIYIYIYIFGKKRITSKKIKQKKNDEKKRITLIKKQKVEMEIWKQKYANMN